MLVINMDETIMLTCTNCDLKFERRTEYDNAKKDLGTWHSLCGDCASVKYINELKEELKLCLIDRQILNTIHKDIDKQLNAIHNKDLRTDTFLKGVKWVKTNLEDLENKK